MTISIPDSTLDTITDADGNQLQMITGPDVYQPLRETTAAVVVLRSELAKLDSTEGLKLADFGTGTGQLAVFAKKFFPELDVYAYDNDPNAEKYILANAELHNVDITSTIANVADISDSEEFDIVISCPPFYPELLKRVGYSGAHKNDPETSVYGGKAGTETQGLFLDKAGKTLKTNGILIVVHSLPQKGSIYTMLDENGFTNASTQLVNSGEELDLADAVFTIAYKN